MATNTQAIGVAYADQAIVSGQVDATPIGSVTPSTVVGTTVYCTQEIGYTADAQGTVTQASSADITLRNMTGGNLSEAVVINFAIIHGAS
ncbi:MAG: hypothetical protein EBR82_82825 [Caulobacteraceae bacterium]|nr:hypothetical protein [Caulobacteraceae bacterium]